MFSSSTVRTILAKPFMPPVFFFSGVTYDTLTLTRIDRLQDNLILLLYLVTLGFLIVLTGRLGVAAVEPSAIEPHGSSFARFLIKARPYYPMAMQFLLGGLFSAYAIFYSRSATLTRTGIFLGVLVVLLMANEFLRDRLSNLRLLVALYALASFSFFTFFLPVMVGTIGTWVFLLGAALSVGVTLRVVQLIYQHNPERSQKEAVLVGGPAIALIGLLIGFYFLNWIPPVPLSMKFGGMYREVQKQDDRFVLSFDREWYQVWKRSQNPFPADEPSLLLHRRLRPGGSEHDRLPPLVLPTEQRQALHPCRQDSDQDCRRPGRRLPGLYVQATARFGGLACGRRNRRRPGCRASVGRRGRAGRDRGDGQIALVLMSNETS